jgi:predicted secreted protein
MSELTGQQEEVIRRVEAFKALLKSDTTAQRRKIRMSRVRAEEDADRARKGTMVPPLERGQHGKIIEETILTTDQEMTRALVRRAQSPIERYAKRGFISERQADAANDLRADWEFGVVGVNDTGRSGNGGGVSGYTGAQLDAATRYREAVQALGLRISAIVLPVVIGLSGGGEITVDTLAKRQNESREQVMGVLKTGLDMLGDHYASCSDKRRAAKYG